MAYFHDDPLREQADYLGVPLGKLLTFAARHHITIGPGQGLSGSALLQFMEEQDRPARAERERQQQQQREEADRESQQRQQQFQELMQELRHLLACTPSTEARILLGLPQAGPLAPAAIRAAFRRAAAVNHPDKGGDPLQFHRLTDARDLLLQEVA